MHWWQIALLFFTTIGVAVLLKQYFHHSDGGCADGQCLPTRRSED